MLEKQRVNHPAIAFPPVFLHKILYNNIGNDYNGHKK